MLIYAAKKRSQRGQYIAGEVILIVNQCPPDLGYVDGALNLRSIDKIKKQIRAGREETKYWYLLSHIPF